MTDQHPLTDEICEDLSFCKPFVTTPTRSMRAAADWQLEQVTEWVKDHAAEYVYEDYCGPCFDENGLLNDLEKAMRPLPPQQQEDNQ